MKKLLAALLFCAFCVNLIACQPTSNEQFAGSNAASSPTQAAVSTQGAAPTETARLTNDESFKIEQTLDDNQKFAGSRITFTMQEYAQSGNVYYTAKLTVDEGNNRSLTADYGQIWNATEYPDDIEVIDMDNGMLIYLKFVLGYGQYEAPALARYDGDSLEFIKWPFSDLSFYDWPQTYKPTFKDEPAPLFDFTWTGDTTFDLTCNLGGGTKHYEVNTKYYETVLDGLYADFDRNNSPEIARLAAEKPTDKGEIKLYADITYGEHLIIAVNTVITLQFDEASRSLVFKSIDYSPDGCLSTTGDCAVTEVN